MLIPSSCDRSICALPRSGRSRRDSRRARIERMRHPGLSCLSNGGSFIMSGTRHRPTRSNISIGIAGKTALGAFAVSVSAAFSTFPTTAQETDGAELFQRRCAACHSVEPAGNKTGPHLSGLIGRPAATVEGATYSNALRNAGITWDRQSLDRFLTAPRQLVPGTRMAVTVPDARQRAAIIDYLENPSNN